MRWQDELLKYDRLDFMKLRGLEEVSFSIAVDFACLDDLSRLSWLHNKPAVSVSVGAIMTVLFIGVRLAGAYVVLASSFQTSRRVM